MTKLIADKSVVDLNKEIAKLKKVAKDLECSLPEKKHELIQWNK
ncbi:hypothetical protein AB9B74_05690 [Klebsiella aerogenes]